jgi:hypothetical protein
MKGHGKKLTRKQEQAIATLRAEPTLGSPARRCGVSETTLWRWLQEEEDFQAAYKAARRSVVNAATTSLQQAATEAIACLRRALTCGQVAAEVRAAGVILEHVFGTVDRLDLEERLGRPETLPELQGVNRGT